MKGRIYYFTGTGNSMRAARVIAQQLKDTEIISMRVNPEEVPATDCDVIGFIFPVYHWTMPEQTVTSLDLYFLCITGPCPHRQRLLWKSWLSIHTHIYSRSLCPVLFVE